MDDQSEAFDDVREALDHLYVTAREQATAQGLHERRWTLLADKIEEASLYAARGAQEAASVEETLQAPTPVAVPPTPDPGHARHREENR